MSIGGALTKPMNRRSFLKSIVALAASHSLGGFELLASKPTVLFQDRYYVDYIVMTFNIYVDNPAKCGVITNIGEEDV